MATREIARIERVDLREVWPNEERDFTPWLTENIEVLGEVLNLELADAEREVGAGDFVVDVRAQTDDGALVVIENQLTRSDHSHLGKLLTYRAMLDARIAVWIVAEARPEHVKAISWLNESADADFYLVKLEAVRIADSPPAPLMTIVVGPSEATKETGEKRREMAERERKRLEFWSQLLERASSRTNLFASRSPGPDSYLDAGAGKSGLSFRFLIRKDGAEVDLYIYRGRGRDEENVRIFEQLLRHREAIEAAFGDRLEWQSLEGRHACRVSYVVCDVGWGDEDRWPEAQEKMVDAMIRLESAFRPYIDQLDI